MYVLDTNTLIYFFKGLGAVAKNLLAKTPKEIAIPSIVLFELEVGIAKSSSPPEEETTAKGVGIINPNPSFRLLRSPCGRFHSDSP